MRQPHLRGFLLDRSLAGIQRRGRAELHHVDGVVEDLDAATTLFVDSDSSRRERRHGRKD